MADLSAEDSAELADCLGPVRWFEPFVAQWATCGVARFSSQGGNTRHRTAHHH
jgi:hypothetical protein